MGEIDVQTEIDNTRLSLASPIQKGKDSQKENSLPDDHSRILVDKDGITGSGSDGSEVQNERPLSPETRALLCDEEDTMFMAGGGSPSRLLAGHCQSTNQKSNDQEYTKVYAEQERLILTRFRDFLNRLITCGSIKGNFSMLYNFNVER